MTEEWHAQGSDCCSPLDACCLAWWVPCVQYGRIHHRLHVDGALQNWSFFNMDCCAWYCLAHVGCQWVVQMMQRGEIRKKYNLKGDGMTDCLCACCCGPCDLVQQDKEAEFREQQRLGMPVPIQNQPVKVQGMQYPQQGYQQQGYAQQYTQ